RASRRSARGDGSCGRASPMGRSSTGGDLRPARIADDPRRFGDLRRAQRRRLAGDARYRPLARTGGAAGAWRAGGGLSDRPCRARSCRRARCARSRAQPRAARCRRPGNRQPVLAACRGAAGRAGERSSRSRNPQAGAGAGRAAGGAAPAPPPTAPVARAAQGRCAGYGARYADRDPYQFYAKHILRLEPLDALDAEPTPAWQGSLAHAILQAWHERGGDIRAIALEMLREMNAHPLMRALWQPRLLAALDWVSETVRAAESE